MRPFRGELKEAAAMEERGELNEPASIEEGGSNAATGELPQLAMMSTVSILVQVGLTLTTRSCL